MRRSALSNSEEEADADNEIRSLSDTYDIRARARACRKIEALET